MAGRPWTEEEVEKLLRLAKTHRLDQITDAFEGTRSHHSIRIRLKRVHGIRPIPSQRRRAGLWIDYWSEKDTQTLFALAGTMTAAQIGKRLRRTANAVKVKASRLGINLRQGIITLTDVCEILGGVDNRTARTYARVAGVRARNMMKDGKLNGKGFSEEDIAKIAQAILDNPDVGIKLKPSARHLRQVIEDYGTTYDVDSCGDQDAV